MQPASVNAPAACQAAAPVLSRLHRLPGNGASREGRVRGGAAARSARAPSRGSSAPAPHHLPTPDLTSLAPPPGSGPRRSPYLLLCCLFLSINYSVSATLYFLRASVVSASMRDSNTRVAFFAALNSASALLIFGFQVLATGVARRHGGGGRGAASSGPGGRERQEKDAPAYLR